MDAFLWYLIGGSLVVGLAGLAMWSGDGGLFDRLWGFFDDEDFPRSDVDDLSSSAGESSFPDALRHFDADSEVHMDDEGQYFNPASGLPMVNGIGGFDVAGNPYGVDDSFDSGTFDTDWHLGSPFDDHP